MAVLVLVWLYPSLCRVIDPFPEPAFALHVRVAGPEAMELLAQEVFAKTVRMLGEYMMKDSPRGGPD